MLSCLEEPCFGGVLPGTVLAVSGSAFRLGGRGGGRGSVDGQLSDSSDLASFLSLASFFPFFLFCLSCVFCPLEFSLPQVCFLNSGMKGPRRSGCHLRRFQISLLETCLLSSGVNSRQTGWPLRRCCSDIVGERTPC